MTSTVAALLGLLLAGPLDETGLQLSSPQVREGKPLARALAYDQSGCGGRNLSPRLDWSGAPEGTRSFALTVFDPDAPGGGFWHWLVWDLPAGARALPAGGPRARLPDGVVQGRNDFGVHAYAGPCPPPRDRPHRYVFTLWALDVERLGLQPGASAGALAVELTRHALGRATLTATYRR